MTIIDLKLFIFKRKLIIYIEAFIELYNSKSCEYVNEINGIIDFKKIYILTIKNPYNLDAYKIIKSSLILYNIYFVSKNQD